MAEKPNNTLEEFKFNQEFTSWEDFEKHVIKINSFYISTYLHNKINICNPYIEPTIFRGLGDSNWKLDSTLQRKREFITTTDYYGIICDSSKVINTCFEKNWDIPYLEKLEKPNILEIMKQREKLGKKSLWLEIDKSWENTKKKPYWIDEKVLEFMTYLRHNGFPSPLLDWTRSPYIAAFFAFNSNEDITGKIAIISHTKFYTKHENSTKHDSKKDTEIQMIGEYIKSHKRHYLQQSEYTICIKTGEQETNFAHYNEITVQENPKEDLIIKFILPAHEKEKVLKTLDNKMNINAYSLFGTEEALMNTLSNKVI